MHAALMKHPGRMATIAALVLTVGAVLAFALLSGSTRTAQAAVHHATHHVTHHARQHARLASDPTGSSDPDNVQSGDQTTPDATSTATPGETSGETSGEAPGDQQPAGGGLDFQGECTGDCVQ